ncbi:MAG: PhzF family phenazine biosynthesis protein [Candidatus Thorarchaeota archaeon]|nr:PhzF family phenazine biosynthesis protein [Candidatus Thorarchaeota archaeon]
MKRSSEIPVLQVDAYTDVPYGGNPAVVVLRADRLDEKMTERVSREMAVAQTVFVYPSKKADMRLRFMTPRGEMAFSGHLVTAALAALLDTGDIEAVADVSMFTAETASGIVQVEVVKNESTGMHEIQISRESPKFMNTYDPKEYAEALGLNLADIMTQGPIQTVSTGIPQVMIPVRTIKALERVHPNWDRLDALQKESDWLSMQLFTRETLEPTSDVHVRHFAPALGIPEDPVTGSGAASMGSYMIKYGLFEPTIPVTSIVVEQGHFMKRPGKLFIEVQGDATDIRLVKVSGTCVIVMRGLLLI